jgi:hypothetical protein
MLNCDVLRSQGCTEQVWECEHYKHACGK